MAKFPVVSAKQLVKFFLDRGFHKDHKTGRHIILTKKGIPRPVVIPDQKELSIGIVLNNLETAGITKAEFVAAMRGKKKK